MFRVSRMMPKEDQQDQRADAEGERRINPGLAGGQDGPAANDHGGGWRGYPPACGQGAADVHVATGAMQQEGNAAVITTANGGDRHH